MQLNFSEHGITTGILIWIICGVLPFFFVRMKVNSLFYIPSILASLLILFCSCLNMGQDKVIALSLSLGLPDFPFLVRIDRLSNFFLILLGFSSTGISLFSLSYFRNLNNLQFRSLFVFYHLFLVGMAWVFISNDGYSFLIAWELMALASYFLVTVNHHSSESRKACFIYLLMSHIGAAAILLSLGIMQHGTGGFSFDVLRHVTLTHHWKLIAFLLAFLGFAVKAGLVPFHVWLPEAHPAAPSPISALMSGVMVKTAIYGFLRFSFDLLGAHFPTWVGLLLVLIGLCSAFFSVIYAIIQTDMKRLLAYSTIENMGLIFAITGLSLTFLGLGKTDLSALALIAVLFHCLSHSVFKSLLFLSTGNVLHATGERNLGKLGGLIRTMPWVAMISLIGSIGMAGLPPLNGFVSEWLMLQSFLTFAELPESYITLILPLCAALFILIVGLAGYMSVKLFGVIFLGQPREEKLKDAKDAPFIEKIALIYFALFCVILGIFPNYFINYIKPLASTILNIDPTLGVFVQKSLTIIPISEIKATYTPLLYMVMILTLTLGTFVTIRLLYHGQIRRSDPWACGLRNLGPRTQDTAEGFGQPLKEVYSHFMKISRQNLEVNGIKTEYNSVIHDYFWDHLYVPIRNFIEKSSLLFAKIQHGKINIYLTYSVITLIFMLVAIKWMLR